MEQQPLSEHKEKNHYTPGSVGERVRLFFIGFAMGVADLIPGISGGTIALIANVYDELVASIKVTTNTAVSLFLKGKSREAVRVIPFGFLVPLLAGLLFAVFSMANILSRLFDSYAEFVWSFFFGLIAASVFVVFRRVQIRSTGVLISALIGAVASYMITGLIPVETPATALLLFLSGAIAITAMILPGISGSFILIILGKYQQILAAVVERDVMTLGIFLLGILTGLALFSRVISYFLRTHHDITIALLTGFIIGSIRTVWPWKETTPIGVEVNVLPEVFDLSVGISIALALIGATIILVVDRLEVGKK
ncbi:MAG: DUF368 domain-containing protein [Candidatus Paceibacterota bacterium]